MDNIIFPPFWVKWTNFLKDTIYQTHKKIQNLKRHLSIKGTKSIGNSLPKQKAPPQMVSPLSVP